MDNRCNGDKPEDERLKDDSRFKNNTPKYEIPLMLPKHF